MKGRRYLPLTKENRMVEKIKVINQEVIDGKLTAKEGLDKIVALYSKEEENDKA